jgi:hypothetical protein
MQEKEISAECAESTERAEKEKTEGRKKADMGG